MESSAADPSQEMDETLRDEDDDQDMQNAPKEPSAEAPLKEEKDNEKNETVGSSSSSTSTTVGGTLETAAYCLLEGLLEETSDTDTVVTPAVVHTTKIRVPIDRVPAVLGRSHKHSTQDASFIALGPTKSLSRQHVQISYHLADGTRLELVEEKDKKKKAEPKWTVKPKSERMDILNKPKLLQDSDTGFFCMTCLGKNRVVVDGTKVEQGQTVALRHGSTVSLSTYSLYFLLPSAGTAATIVLEDDAGAPAPAKKRKLSITASVGSSSTAPTTTSTSTPTPRLNAMTSLQKELDKIDTATLRAQCTKAVEDGVWERRHQLMGSTLAYRAVLKAAADPVLRQKADTGGGLSRGDLIAWIAASEEFKVWVTQMSQKLEPKSYQASITKAMIKANYQRTAGSGRYIKWSMPNVADIPKPWENKVETTTTTSAPPKEQEREADDSGPDTGSQQEKEEEQEEQEEEEQDDEEQEEEQEDEEQDDEDAGDTTQEETQESGRDKELII